MSPIVREGRATLILALPLMAGQVSQMLMGLIVSLFFVGVFLVFREPLAAAFLKAPQPLEIAVGLLSIAALFQLADHSQILSAGVLRGLDDVKGPALIMFGSHWLIGMPLGAWLTFGLNWAEPGNRRHLVGPERRPAGDGGIAGMAGLADDGKTRLKRCFPAGSLPMTSWENGTRRKIKRENSVSSAVWGIRTIASFAIIASSFVAAASEHWAYRPVANPPRPEVGTDGWAREDLDRFILARMKAEGWQPSHPATKRTLVRRAFLDLHGLPPTTAQIAAFIEDERPDAWARLIDELLASPRYGERWGRHWLDVARYADTNGMDEDIAHPSAWRYRDYVIDSFNADKPFDRFIVEQLAGDLLPHDDLAQQREQTIATGFLSVGPKMLACDDPDKMRRDIVDEQMDTMGRAFLGMTIGCARCHDHKIDPISIEEYYSLAGIFMSTKTLTKYSVVAQFHEHDLSSAEVKKGWQELRRLEGLKKKKETPKEKKESLGREIAALKKDLPAPFRVMGPTEYPTQNVRVHLRGNYLDLGDEVPRGVPAAWTGGEKVTMPAKQSGRLELARWITSDNNPLTARVIVNRLWRWHFGRSLVPTPDNFGGLGERPTHPQLLDHLATAFIESGWSVQAMHRLIMNSATYRQSSQAMADLLEADPDNHLFARWQRRRVEAEVVRDSILQKSGRLDLTMGGSLLVARPNHYADRSHLKAHSLEPRRTVYLPVYRSTGYDGQKAFDVADPAVPNGNRRTSTVAGQALYLMNSQLMHQSSEALGARVVTIPVAERAAWLVEHILDRPATTAECRRGEEFVKSYGNEKEAWAAFARVLLSSNEFLYLE